MHLPHHLEDCHCVTLPAQAAHLQAKRRKALAERLLPPSILTAARPLSITLASRLHQFLRSLRDYAHTLTEKRLGYEYGDPEYDHTLAELRTLEAIRERLIAAELIPASYLLEPSAEDITHGHEVAPATPSVSAA